jgi:hypothetical protein
MARALVCVTCDTLHPLLVACGGPVLKLTCHDSACIVQDQTPPKDPSIEVRVLKDYGEVFLSLGRANLKKGTVHLLPRTEAEPLIREGVLESVAHDVHLS